MAKVQDQIKGSIEPAIEALGFSLFDIEFVKEGKAWYLRIYIDKEGGVTIEDCVETSERLSEILDQLDPDPIPQAYYLEVSSPGAERPLKTEEAIQSAIGEDVHLNFYSAVDGNKFAEGKLLQASKETFVIEVKDKTQRIKKSFDRKNVSLIRLAILF